MFRKITSLLLVSAAALPQLYAADKEFKISVANPTSAVVTEVVEAAVPASVGDFSSLALYNAKGEAVGYQPLTAERKIAFVATVQAKASEAFTLKSGKPQLPQPLTYGRIVPERLDDYAWETPYSAWRMYSTTLLPKEPNTSNGIDMWCKRVGSLMVDSLYAISKNGGRYHDEHVIGGDGYQVGGKTLGCGGVAAFAKDKLWLHKPFDTCYTVHNGPYRTEFVLVYRQVEVEGDFYTKTVRITASASSVLCKAVVKYEGKEKPMQLATGLFLHKATEGVPYISRSGGRIAYAEKHSEGKWTTPVRYFEGIYHPQSSTVGFIFDNHLMLASDYTPNTDFTYYFGGTNSLNVSAKITTDNEWFDAMDKFAPQQLVVK
jgi:hypothetical protein